ncbi:1-deoxy-D-xylulose-5-phosphate synthase N-terminal domain-containing protein [Haloechinothrix halophila]|uniref:1-deoxy-D-xylulose-5-phosphate synthase N-terminal domain-containing protein n=1 Tax=Haloechinothrix halophila TaxID=1069073 RepID=UPI00040DA50F|nr:1-deoxy-D-xylulose-5-phosphate synthase N-terminal domain-containing protein [Haloechinothrix halophila]
MTSSGDTLLSRVNEPSDLRGLSETEVARLASEAKEHLDTRTEALSGGTVELTLAVHRIFTAPKDVLLFDTHHTAAARGILTSRAEEPAHAPPQFSDHAHAATPLSYADGMAKAFAVRGTTRKRRVVAVIGDDALTSGLSWEALNNIGAAPTRPVVVVLNDGGKPYASVQGGIARHLTELKRAAAGLAASQIPVQRRGKPLRTNVFTDLGFVYIGPVDGHNMNALERALRRAATVGRPVLVHCVTKQQTESVAVPPETTKRRRSRARRTWTSVFETELAAIGADRDDVVCVTAGTGVGEFATRFPDRVFDVGNAEPHAITSAAGLALGGARPVVRLRADALPRAFDRLLADVARHRLPVTVGLDHAGVNGQGDHGVWDPAVLAAIPGLWLGAPRDTVRLREMLRQAIERDTGPTVLRHPPGPAPLDVPAARRVGPCDVLREAADPDVVLLAPGALAQPCLAAAESLALREVSATVLDPRWSVPADSALIKLLAPHRMVVVVEEATATGGLGARLAQALAAAGSGTRVVTHALPPRFLPRASRDQLLRACSLDASGIAQVVGTLLGKPSLRQG